MLMPGHIRYHRIIHVTYNSFIARCRDGPVLGKVYKGLKELFLAFLLQQVTRAVSFDGSWSCFELLLFRGRTLERRFVVFRPCLNAIEPRLENFGGNEL